MNIIIGLSELAIVVISVLIKVILMMNVLALMENLCNVQANANNPSLTHNIDRLGDF